MNGKHEIELAGCTPEPLLNYLKALGVIRLVAEQKDAGALACWRRDRLCLISTLDRNDLIKFFLHEYRPTPILGAWNAGCGLYKKWDPKKGEFSGREVVEALERISCSTSDRLRPYREEITRLKTFLKQSAKRFDPSAMVEELRREGLDDKAIRERLGDYLLFDLAGAVFALEKADKDEFLLRLRNEILADCGVEFFDAAVVLTDHPGKPGSRRFAPLLGTGGVMGNSEFSARFVSLLPQVIPLHDGDQPPPESAELLETALMGTQRPGLKPFAVDYFAPGKAGGANMTQGFEGEYRLNPWDYVLMLEGTLLFAGSVGRRLYRIWETQLNSRELSAAGFPFSVAPSLGGNGSEGSEQATGELWLPLWERPCGYTELRALFAEGRGQLARRPAVRGTDFARAIVSLGVDRGLTEFVRVGLRKRFGDNLLAVSFGRIPVRFLPPAGLLHQLESWLDQFRNEATDPHAPHALRRCLVDVENAIFNYCRYGRREDLQQILVALGQAEQAVALRASRNQEQEEVPIAPFRSLSSQWVAEADDGSDAYRLALAIASIHQRYPAGESQRQALPPVRANLEPVEYDNKRWKWKPMSPSVAWQPGPLARNLAAILERRLLEAANVASPELPLASRYGVDLDVVAWWLADDSADRRIAELIPGLALVDYSEPVQLKRAPKGLEVTPPLPRAYALLKLLFLPQPLVPPSPDRPYWRLVGPNEQGIRIKPEMRILALLRAGRIEEACQVAYRRLRASGLVPLPGPQASRPVRERDWLETAGLDPQRLAAALLIPITPAAVHAAASLVLRPPKELPPEPGAPAASFEDSSANEFISAI